MSYNINYSLENTSSNIELPSDIAWQSINELPSEVTWRSIEEMNTFSETPRQRDLSKSGPGPGGGPSRPALPLSDPIMPFIVIVFIHVFLLFVRTRLRRKQVSK